MSNIINLDTEERIFKEANSKHEALQSLLFKAENEIVLLNHIKSGLEENISILKSRHIIPMLLEYRKAREDLGKVCNNLMMLRINRNNLEHSIGQAKKYLDECRQKYLISIESNRSKVIEVDFRRKNGQNGDSR